MVTQPDPARPQGHNAFHIAGVGASAGGLEALEQLFEGMPLDSGIAFVVVQHLSPDFKSHMAELLERKTKIPIRRVEDGMEVQPDNIYLIPANKEMVIAEGRLRLTERNRDQPLSHPIDLFFRSLAADAGGRGIAVVLSGTGSDGSRGIRDIHAAGGLVIAQDEASARFDGMPLNALATGVVDVVLPPPAIRDAMTRYVAEGLKPDALAKSELLETATGVDRIFELLRNSTNVDFSHYKATTVGRRVQRRMQIAAIRDLEDYCHKLETDPAELDALYKDLLIGVTRFFRDREAFEIIEHEVLPELIAKARSKGELRVWVAGCASGEEAYSLAILLDEAIRKSGSKIEMKIFATDIHHGSLASASQGIYPADLVGEMSEERRARYFVGRKGGFQVHRDLRACVVFASHNVFHDAPFTQLDLVTCRNLLIYLQPAAQKKAISLFHFGLRVGGVMFLGTSETPGELNDEFEPVSSKWRIYRKRRNVRLPIETRSPFPTTQHSVPRPALRAGTAAAGSPASSLLATYDRLLDLHMPASVLVDEHGSVVHVFGGAERFLRVRGGRPSALLPDIVDENLRTPLIGALQHAARDRSEVRYNGIALGDDAAVVDLAVTPLFDPRTRDLQMLVKFLDGSEARPAASSAGTQAPGVEVRLDNAAKARIDSMEAELRFTQENLQATIEELETSNEELQAANEEMLASNEELQSTNEELQSVNEELYTVNTEHQKKIEELVRAHDDMDNLLALTRVGVIFLDDERCIRRFTPEIGRLFHLLPQDIGRSFSSFEHNLPTPGIAEKIDEALAGEVQVEMRVEDRQGRPFLLRIAPYRRSDDVSGVAVTLVDVAKLEQTQQDVAKFKQLAEQASDMFLLFDHAGTIRYANPSVAEHVGRPVDELVGAPGAVLGTDFDTPHLTQWTHRAEAGDGAHQHVTAVLHRDGSRLPIEISASIVRVGAEVMLFVSARDISARLESDQQLALYHSAIAATTSGIIITDARAEDQPLVYVNEGFSKMTGFSPEEALGRNCRFLQGEDTDPEARRRVRDAIAEGRHERITIRNYRKDGTPFWNDLSVNPVRDREQRITHFVGIQNDISGPMEAERLARDREARLRTLLDSTAEGIFGLDDDGRCSFCNAAALGMLGYADESLAVGRTLFDLVNIPDGETRHRKKLEALQGTTAVRLRGQAFWTQNGRKLPVDVSMQPIQREGQAIGNVVTFVDTTRRARQERKLRAARIEADAANRAKSEFLANMSHEIRTPLTAIIGFTDLIQLGSEPVKEGEHIAAIKRNAKYLLDIVNDILDLSKVEAEHLDLQIENVVLLDLITDLHSAMAVRARDAGLELNFELATPIPASIPSDRARLRQILLNLVGNAIKFTERGQVTVRFAFDRPNGVLEAAVIDTGIGIAPDVQSRLFAPFQQADPTIERRFGGTGLGLSITKKLIERLGGSIELVSAVGQGSEFTIRVPTGDVGADAQLLDEICWASEPTDDLPRASIEPLHGRVLVVDDQADVRSAATQLLDTVGAEVTTAANGLEAVDLLRGRTDEIDLVLLDLQMPQQSGFDTLREFRRLGFEGPVLAFTAQAMKGEFQRCLDAGFDGYVAKPIDTQVLIETIRQQLSDAKASAIQRILVVEDNRDSAEVLALLLSRREGREVKVAHSGAEALEIAKAFLPGICLVDNGLPDMTGAQLVEQLKGMPGMDTTAYFAVTGVAKEHGAFEEFDAYLLKPVDIAALEHEIENVGRARGEAR